MIVVIEELKPKVNSAGLTVDQIRTVIEQKLRTANIQVMSQDNQRKSVERFPYLYVHATTAFVENVPYVVYNISLDVNHEVVLIPEAVLEVTSAMVRKGFKTLCNKQNEEAIQAAQKICEREKECTDDSSLKPLADKTSCYATIWHQSYTGMAATDKMQGKIMNLINELVDDFLNDYHTINFGKPNDEKEI